MASLDRLNSEFSFPIIPLPPAVSDEEYRFWLELRNLLMRKLLASTMVISGNIVVGGDGHVGGNFEEQEPVLLEIGSLTIYTRYRISAYVISSSSWNAAKQDSNNGFGSWSSWSDFFDYTCPGDGGDPGLLNWLEGSIVCIRHEEEHLPGMFEWHIGKRLKRQGKFQFFAALNQDQQDIYDASSRFWIKCTIGSETPPSEPPNATTVKSDLYVGNSLVGNYDALQEEVTVTFEITAAEAADCLYAGSGLLVDVPDTDDENFNSWPEPQCPHQAPLTGDINHVNYLNAVRVSNAVLYGSI